MFFEGKIAAERSFAVVTGEARLPAGRRKMLGRGRRTDLSRLWRAGGEFVTVSTRESLARVVLRMTERVTIRTRRGARWPVRFLVVTNATRCNLTSRIGFARRCVARVATIVRSEIRRNRQTHATVDRRTVTTRATSLRSRRARHVLSVIELHVERLIETRGKIL